MNWKPGQWIECEQTQEKGKIVPYNGNAIRVFLGNGITLYISPEALEIMGWKPMCFNCRNTS